MLFDEAPPLAIRVLLGIAFLGGAMAVMLALAYVAGRLVGAWLRLRCTHCLGPVACTNASCRTDGPAVFRGRTVYAGWCPRCRCSVEAVRMPKPR